MNGMGYAIDSSVVLKSFQTMFHCHSLLVVFVEINEGETFGKLEGAMQKGLGDVVGSGRRLRHGHLGVLVWIVTRELQATTFSVARRDSNGSREKGQIDGVCKSTCNANFGLLGVMVDP